MKVFLISGLGADRRAFEKLMLHFDEHIIHVDWFTPSNKESISNYSERLINQYKISKVDILIGLSFGGIISVEITKQIQNRKTIIISSARNKYDLPLIYRLSGNLGLHKLIPKSQLNKSNRILEYAFGVNSSDERKLLNEIVSDSNPLFVKWAIGVLSNWTEKRENNSIVRIHGTRDRVIPYNGLVDYTIKGGGHFMIAQNADKISKILNTELDNLK